ncbi:hypothetical protein [Micromonospora yangpuensis]|uniref:Uncharacterized protein n=1 Tax=Micromonospora yangpuensis TaxID=683228 RepID=A0A1C6VDQ0_9ACTN|nr:hypothetical protein [Micromonospora yangpuensis]GGM14109.1 hypothetical protein GCM10012279_35290 [Micromonospora yangpuensis]SCL64483.1 hypothetical protein GA0070617_5484 [Micromonospora yangpuensis]
MPSAKPRAHSSLGLEVWAVGTHDELIALRSQLAAGGRLVEVGDPHILAGADAGRCRQYIRTQIRSAA